MYKIIDRIVGEIIESENLEAITNELEDRMENYSHPISKMLTSKIIEISERKGD